MTLYGQLGMFGGSVIGRQAIEASRNEQMIADIAMIVSSPLSFAALRDICVTVCSHYPHFTQDTLSWLYRDLSANAATELTRDFWTIHAERIPA